MAKLEEKLKELGYKKDFEVHSKKILIFFRKSKWVFASIQIVIDKELNEVLKIKSITSSVIGTDIIFNTNSESGESFDLFSTRRDIYYLEVDGKLYSSDSSSYLNDVYIIKFPTIKQNDIKTHLKFPY